VEWLRLFWRPEQVNTLTARNRNFDILNKAQSCTEGPSIWLKNVKLLSAEQLFFFI
jgi:hypothetical protein